MIENEPKLTQEMIDGLAPFVAFICTVLGEPIPPELGIDAQTVTQEDYVYLDQIDMGAIQ